MCGNYQSGHAYLQGKSGLPGKQKKKKKKKKVDWWWLRGIK